MPYPATKTASMTVDVFADDVPLVAATRGLDVGSLHRGALSIRSDSGQPVYDRGDPAAPAYLRSAAKPFQALPAVLGGAIEQFGLTGAELAILCASHSGEDRHMRTVQAVLDKLGLDPTDLRCGVHPPMHTPTATRRAAEGLDPTPLCHNCSGSHAAMLAACLVNGWPIDTYGYPNHPVQIQIRQILAEYAGTRLDAIRMAQDNCYVPTFAMSLEDAATAFARLWTGTGVNAKLGEAGHRVVTAMAAHPEMIGGEGRFDTDLMVVTKGNVVAKGGAEGYQAVIVRDAHLGLALKISDGSTRAVAPATVHVLQHIGALDEAQVRTLAHHARPETLDRDGVLIGTLETVFD